MINSLDLNKYRELYQDFLNPNPNINSQAFLLLRKEFEIKFMNNLLANLKEEDLFIRRKSILALGMFGEKILKSIVALYINNKAFLILKKEYEVKFIKNLLANLKEEDLFIRRKSILALGRFGKKALNSIVPLYISTNDTTVKVSCLKTIIKVVVNFDLEELNQEEMYLVDLALKDDSPEIILTVISLLRQLGATGRNILIKTCRDKDLLKAKASISALLEMQDDNVDKLFNEILNDKSIDPIIVEDILRYKII